MRNNIYINGEEAFATYGVVMGTGFIDALEGGCPLKDPIENDSRREHGVRMLVSTRLNKRTVTLKFNIHGESREEYLANKRRFEGVLLGGIVDIRIAGRDETYHLVYSGKSVTYHHSYNGVFGTWTASFTEPDPSNRTEQKNDYVSTL